MRSNTTIAAAVITIALQITDADAQTRTPGASPGCVYGIQHVIKECRMSGRIKLCEVEEWRNGQIVGHATRTEAGLAAIASCTVSQPPGPADPAANPPQPGAQNSVLANMLRWMASLMSSGNAANTPPTGPGDPGVRVCCAFGTNDTPLDPNALRGHSYGWKNKAEPSGYIYTDNAGLVDVGHVRDNADLTRYVFEALLAGYTGVLNTPYGSVRIPTKIQGTPDTLLNVAGAIAYVDGWAHELETWVSQEFSSFSPEDLPSNVIGVQLATRAIRASGGSHTSEDQFNKAVDVEIDRLMRELGAWTKQDTDGMIKLVEFHLALPNPDTSVDGKWWVYDVLSNPLNNALIRLLRRNFSADPWLLLFPGRRTPQPLEWLNSARFEREYGKFYFVARDGIDATRVPADASADGGATGPSFFVKWVPVPAGTIPGANFSVRSGQFISAKVNMADGTTQVIATTLSAATQGIAAAFAGANPGRDRP